MADERHSPQGVHHHHHKNAQDFTERNLAGLYVYQHYLKRLRRLHQDYIKKFHAMKQHQKASKPDDSLQTEPGLCHPHYHHHHHQLERSYTAGPDLHQKCHSPLNKLCIKIDQSHELRLSQGKSYDQSETGSHLPQLSNRRPQSTGLNDDRVSPKDGGDLFRREEAIYIPCGREHSEIWMLKLKMRKQRNRDRDGAWSFRTWKNVQQLSSTCYST